MLTTLLALVDWGDLMDELRSANYLYLVPAIGLYFIGQWFRALRWQYLLSHIARIPARRLYSPVIIGHTVNNVLPLRLGEIMRAAYLSQREPGVSTSASFATLSIERLYDGLTQLAIYAVSATILLTAGIFSDSNLTYRSTAIVLTLGMVSYIAATFLVLTTLAKSRRAVGWLIALTGILPPRFRTKAANVTVDFVAGLAPLTTPRKHAVIFIGSLPIWLVETGVFLLIAHSFNLGAYFPSFWVLAMAVLLVMAVSNLVIIIPGPIGGIGPFEIVAQQTLVALGVGSSVAASYSVTLHLMVLWLPVNIVGLLLLWRHNLSPGRIAAMPERERAARTTDG